MTAPRLAIFFFLFAFTANTHALDNWAQRWDFSYTKVALRTRDGVTCQTYRTSKDPGFLYLEVINRTNKAVRVEFEIDTSSKTLVPTNLTALVHANSYWPLGEIRKIPYDKLSPGLIIRAVTPGYLNETETSEIKPDGTVSIQKSYTFSSSPPGF
jgi:hypothetical protein